MGYQRGSLRNQKRYRVLLVLEQRLQLGTSPSTLSSLMVLASTVGPLQESWIRNLVKFLCREGYLKKIGDSYEVLISVPELRTNEEFAQMCMNPPKATTGDRGDEEEDISEALGPEDPKQSTENIVAQDAPSEEDSSLEQSVLAALTERVVELTIATKELRDAVATQTSGAEALRIEVAKQREEFRSLTSELKAEVVMSRTESNSNYTEILGWIAKSETIGEHSKAVINLRESVVDLTESIRPIKDITVEQQKAIEATANKYREEMGSRHREIRESLTTIRQKMEQTLSQMVSIAESTTTCVTKLLKSNADTASKRKRTKSGISASLEEVGMRNLEDNYRILENHPALLGKKPNLPPARAVKRDSILPLNGKD